MAWLLTKRATNRLAKTNHNFIRCYLRAVTRSVRLGTRFGYITLQNLLLYSIFKASVWSLCPWQLSSLRPAVEKTWQLQDNLGDLVCSHLLMLVPDLWIFIPWRWRRYIPPKHRFTQYLYSATSQKMAFFMSDIHYIPRHYRVNNKKRKVKLSL